MKTAGAPLIAHLTSGRQFRRAELWTFTHADGAVLARYTPLDADVTVAGETWLKGGPVLTRPRSRLAAGTEVDEFVIVVEPKETDLILGVTWPIAARRGVLRHGRVAIWRVYFPEWGDVSLGKLWLMGGRMAEMQGDGAQVRITVRSDLELLNVKIPVDVVQPPCKHTLFDSGCKLIAVDFDVAAAASAGSTPSLVRANLAQANGYFSLGRIVFTSGANNGATRYIKLHTAGAPALLDLVKPLLASPAPGDTFTVYPGCDKTQPTCTAKYNNLVNFGGQPFVPRPETAF